eukprot:8018147-Pyramimonas_sp.AAC.1
MLVSFSQRSCVDVTAKRECSNRRRQKRVGPHAVVKPLLSGSATGEFDSPPKYSRAPKKVPFSSLTTVSTQLHYPTASHSHDRSLAERRRGRAQGVDSPADRLP